MGSEASWPVDGTIAGLVDTDTAQTGWTPVTGLVDAGTLSAIATVMRTTHLLNLMIRGMIEVRGANSEKIKGDEKGKEHLWFSKGNATQAFPRQERRPDRISAQNANLAL